MFYFWIIPTLVLNRIVAKLWNNHSNDSTERERCVCFQVPSPSPKASGSCFLLQILGSLAHGIRVFLFDDMIGWFDMQEVEMILNPIF